MCSPISRTTRMMVIYLLFLVHTLRFSAALSSLFPDATTMWKKLLVVSGVLLQSTPNLPQISFPSTLFSSMAPVKQNKGNEMLIRSNRELLDQIIGIVTMNYYDPKQEESQFEQIITWRKAFQDMKLHHEDIFRSNAMIQGSIKQFLLSLQDRYSYYEAPPLLKTSMLTPIQRTAYLEGLQSRPVILADDLALQVPSLGIEVQVQIQSAQVAGDGIHINLIPVITAIFANSPAETVGLHIGDSVGTWNGEVLQTSIQLQRNDGESPASSMIQAFQQDLISLHSYSTASSDRQSLAQQTRHEIMTKLSNLVIKSWNHRQYDVHLGMFLKSQTWANSLEPYSISIPCDVKYLYEAKLVHVADRAMEIDNNNRGEETGKQYIRITQFDHATAKLFDQTLRKTLLSGFKEVSNDPVLVIDLRNNYGGVIQDAMYMASLVILMLTPSLEEALDKIICYTINSRASQVHTVEKVLNFACSKETLDAVQTQFTYIPNLKIKLLVNGGTASAAEVFTAALHETFPNQVEVIGSRTYGKSLIQHIYDLPNRGKLHLTIAQYLTPRKTKLNRGSNSDLNSNIPIPILDEQSSLIGYIPVVDVSLGGGIIPDRTCTSSPMHLSPPSLLSTDLCYLLATE